MEFDSENPARIFRTSRHFVLISRGEYAVVCAAKRREHKSKADLSALGNEIPKDHEFPFRQAVFRQKKPSHHNPELPL